MSMKIDPLADHLDLVETIGTWHWNEWGHVDPAGSRESWIKGLSLKTRRNAIPTTLVALSPNDQPLGSVSLVDCDMDTRPHLWPWLAGLYVTPDARNRGVGSSLVRAAMQQARELEITTFYLYTSTAENLYTRLGWQVIDRDNYEGDNVAVMSVVLA